MQAKFAYGGSILSFSLFSLPQSHLKTTLALKVFKIDSKIIISLPWSKSDSAVIF